MMRRTWVAAGAALAVAALGGCNRGGDAGGRRTVALVMKTLNNPFFVEMEQGARAAADSLGLELVVQAPEREIDVEKQMQIVENLIERRVDVLALVPSGSSADRADDAPSAAHSAGASSSAPRSAAKIPSPVNGSKKSAASPTSVPGSVPSPPIRLVPPITVAAIASSSYIIPAIGCAELSRAVRITAAVALIKPETP